MRFSVAPLALAAMAASVAGAATTPAPREKQVVVAPGVSLHVIDAIAGQGGSPIVFIPGWSTGADIWREQIGRFAADRPVLSFDPRSQGDSTKTPYGNTPEQRAADLHALIASERLEKPILVGWSQAAQDIAAYVLAYGSKDLGGIVLVDAAVSEGARGIIASPRQAAAQFARFSLYLDHQEDYLRGMFGFIVSKPQPKGLIDAAVATGMKTPPSIGLSMLVSDLFGPDRRAALARIDCPVLIVAAGSSGELSQQEAERRVVRNARFVRIDDAAHAVFLDQPDRFAAALGDFLKELDGVRR